jgi:hypothetical protein
MERVGNFLRKYVPAVKDAMEQYTGVGLDEITCRPYADDCVPDTHGKKWTLALYQLLNPELMMTRGLTIYYNTSISTLLVPGDKLWNMAAHELGHIAHRKLVGREELKGPISLQEDIANYFAKQALDRLRKPIVGKVRQGARDFQLLLMCRGVPETQENIVRYVRKEEERLFYGF